MKLFRLMLTRSVIVLSSEISGSGSKDTRCMPARLLNSILQNAADITAVLRALAAEGYTIRREDLAQLSTYLTRHVKRFDDYVVDIETAPEPLNGDMPELID